MSITRHEPSKILSAAVEYGDTVYVAGTVADDPNDSVKAQTVNILKKIDRLLAKSGSHKSRVLSATIWVNDIRHRDKMNEAWIDWMDPANPPARACIEAKLANPLMLVEIAVIAAKGGGKSSKAEKAETPAKVSKPQKRSKGSKPKASEKDNLEVIEGIGPKIAKILTDSGVATYAALAAAQPAAVKKLLEKAGPRFQLAHPGTWAEQARLLASGQTAAFEKLVARLKGGVRR
ncbi:MAG: Rid family hydrolase [Burkholderiales bacterium]